MPQKVTDEEFIAAWRRYNSPTGVRQATGLASESSVMQRRNRIEARYGIDLPTISDRVTPHSPVLKFERRRSVKCKRAVTFSDAHFYPDHGTLAVDALCEVIKNIKPDLVVCLGDALDATQLSRFDPTRGWHTPPSVAEQIDCMQTEMGRIQVAAGKAQLLMCLGNHDARLSRYLAVRAPEFENLPGTKLEDYIPAWPLSWTIEVNENTMLRHRPISGGMHSSYQSPLRAGMHFVHGHLHNLNVRSVPRYKGFHYGVDAGSLSDPTSDAFDYAEDAIPHVQGFAVLSYEDGELLMPELCYIQNGGAYFRGQKIVSE